MVGVFAAEIVVPISIDAADRVWINVCSLQLVVVGASPIAAIRSPTPIEWHRGEKMDSRIGVKIRIVAVAMGEIPWRCIVEMLYLNGYGAVENEIILVCVIMREICASTKVEGTIKAGRQPYLLVQLPRPLTRQILSHQLVGTTELRIAIDSVWRQTACDVGEHARRCIKAIEILRRRQLIPVVSGLRCQFERRGNCVFGIKFDNVSLRFVCRRQFGLNDAQILRLNRADIGVDPVEKKAVTWAARILTSENKLAAEYERQGLPIRSLKSIGRVKRRRQAALAQQRVIVWC